jgi:hypothetical protein
MADTTMVERMVAAFTDENPYAKSADFALSRLGELSPQDEARAELIGEAQALGTLALAYEQRQTRFDLLGIARGEL